MKLFLNATVLIAICFAPAVVRGSIGSVFKCDRNQLKSLDFMVGEWNILVKDSSRARKGTSRVSFVAGNCAIRETLKIGDDYEEVRLLAYDQIGGKWQLSIVDSEHGNIVSMTGHFNGDVLEFITTHQRRDRVLFDRVTIRKTSPGWTMIIDTSGGYGKEWRRIQETEYTREKEPN